MTMVLNPNIGQPINRFNPVPATEDLLATRDLPRTTTSDYFIQRLREIEREVEEKTAERVRAGYLPNYQYDPFKLRLGNLDPEDAEAYRNEIMSLTGGESLLNRGRGPTMIRDYLTPEGYEERSPAGRFRFSPETISADVRAAFLSQTTLRFAKGRGALPADQYVLANTLPRIDTILHNMELVQNYIQSKGKTLILDVETPSLNPEEGIWQLAAQILGPRGGIQAPKSWFFENQYLKKGLVESATEEERAAGISRPKRLDQFLLEGKQTDFKKNMSEFFKMANDPEIQSIAGHNVSAFDFDRLAYTVRHHKAYKDAEFARQAELFFSKFYNRDTKQIGNVIDTNVLARMVLPHLNTAEELKYGPQPYSHSLQNLLLQTDLSQRFSQEELNQAIKRGLHYADVDVPFETRLIQALREHLTGQRQIRTGNFLTNEQRSKIINSAPLGPNIGLTDENLYIGDMLARAGRVSPMEQMSILSRNLSLRAAKLPMATEADIAARINAQDRLIGKRSKAEILPEHLRFLNPTADIPNPVEWYQIQKKLAQSGVPLPGLSLYERHIASMMSSIAGPGMSETEKQMRALTGPDVLGLGRFIEADEAKVVGQRAQISVIPLRHLRGWEEELRAGGHEHLATNFQQGIQLVNLDPFEYRPFRDAQPIKEVAASIDLSEAQRGSLLGYLSRQEEFASEAGQELLSKIERSFKLNSGTYGIQVGTFGGIRGNNDPESPVARLHDLIQRYEGIGARTSDQTPLFQTAFAGSGEAMDLQKGVGYTAGAFLRGDLLSDDEKTSLVEQMAEMVRGYPSIITRDLKAKDIQFLKGVKQDIRPQEDILKSLRLLTNTFKAAPYAFAGAVMSGAGYYAYKKHKRNQRIDETFARMPPEPQDWYRQNYYQSVPYNPRQDPHRYLATANVTANMDANKVNHSIQSQPAKTSIVTGGGYIS